MSFCIVCALCRIYPSRSHQINSEQGPPIPSDLMSDLMDLHKFSFNSLLTLLAVLTLSGSKTLLPEVLALLIYTISLRLAINARFIHNYPTVSRVFHVIPLICTFCMAGIELVSDMQSHTLAVILLVSSVLPFTTIIVDWHHWRHQCEQTPLPIRVREISVV